MKLYKLTYKPFGNSAILIEWPQEITRDIIKNVIDFKQKITEINVKLKLELINTYSSITVIYDSKNHNFLTIKHLLESLYNEESVLLQEKKRRLWKIPVCYDELFGIDIEEITLERRLKKEQLIALHTASVYDVAFIGFLPGFLYLNGLSDKLCFPRKKTPRIKVEKGAVGIGGNQTGIYPISSPGGWNIIGNTPLDFFDVNTENFTPISSGDAIVFYPISIQEYHTIKQLVEQKKYRIESEVIYD